MESLKNVYCEKMGLFLVLWRKKFFSVAGRNEVARHWTARTAARRSRRLRGACGWTFLGACGWTFLGACGWTFLGACVPGGVCAWMDVPGVRSRARWRFGG